MVARRDGTDELSAKARPARLGIGGTLVSAGHLDAPITTDAPTAAAGRFLLVRPS